MNKPFELWPELMSREDVEQCLELSRSQVRTLFQQRDFPILVPGSLKRQKVNRFRLIEYMRGEKP